jgi:hypothetical protein
MASIQEQMIDQVKLLLEGLAAAGVLRRVYTEPKAIGTAPEFPFVSFKVGSDEEYAIDDYGRGKLRSRILISIAVQREATYATKELAALIGQIRGQIIAWKQYFCDAGITVTGIIQITDTQIATFFDDFGFGVLGVDYEGIDDAPAAVPLGLLKSA